MPSSLQHSFCSSPCSGETTLRPLTCWRASGPRMRTTSPGGHRQACFSAWLATSRARTTLTLGRATTTTTCGVGSRGSGPSGRNMKSMSVSIRGPATWPAPTDGPSPRARLPPSPHGVHRPNWRCPLQRPQRRQRPQKRHQRPQERHQQRPQERSRREARAGAQRPRQSSSRGRRRHRRSRMELPRRSSCGRSPRCATR